MAFLSVKELEYRWQQRLILPRIAFDIAAGSFACLLGPSGCGKTTLLRVIAGLEVHHGGVITLDGMHLDASVPPNKRHIGMVFQQPTLFPAKTVSDNVRFGIRHLSRDSQYQRVQELLEHIGLSERADAYPHQLSGGQQHRVALARALAPSPKLLLLDEPFAHLDPERRQRLRQETLALTKREGVTSLMVTHDAAEAMQMGDTVMLMDASGHIRQQGTPHDVYHHPADQFAALALGEINLVSARSDGRAVSSIFGELQRDTNLQGDVWLGVRPQDIVVEMQGQGVDGKVEAVLCTGPEDFLNIRVAHHGLLQARLQHTHHWRVGDTVSIRVNPQRVHVFARHD